MTLAPFARLILILVTLCQVSYAQRAQMNLFKFNPSNGDILTLNGKWEFYWNHLYTPADFKQLPVPKPDTLIKPSAWNDLVINGKKCGSYGYATYRLTLTHLPAQPLMLDVYSIQTACRIFINDSLVAEVGKTGTTAEQVLPMNKDVQVVMPTGATRAEMIIQVANFHHRKGGFVHLPEIGKPDAILHQHLLFYVLDSVESSALAIIGLFLLALYIFRRKDVSVLYFALFCITLSFRPVISVNYLVATLMPHLPWSFMIKLEYLGVFFPCLFMALFIKKRFPQQLPNWMVRALVLVFALQALITLLFPPSVFSWLVMGILILVPLGILILTITIIRAVIAKVDGANYAGIGVVVLFVSLVLKVMSYAGLIPTMHVVITVLDIGFIFMMSLILGSRFSVQFVKVEALQKKTEQQHQEIEQKKQQVERQKEIVEQKNKEITDSINYAKRIQYALLAHDELLNKNLPEHFIFFQPKDIVSGDFYWGTNTFERSKFENSTVQTIKPFNDQTFYLAVCDSTGHGVPGAFMSLLNISFLNEAISEKNMGDPAAVFNHVRQRLIENISQEGQKDGMDGLLLKVETGPQTLAITYAAANNSPVVVRNKTIMELPCDKMPIGKGESVAPFTSHTFQPQAGDMLYLYTDGYADQFGGPKGKKFKYSQLNQLLVDIAHLPMPEQKNRLHERFEAWKGDLEQVDDVCIIGIKL